MKTCNILAPGMMALLAACSGAKSLAVTDAAASADGQRSADAPASDALGAYADAPAEVPRGADARDAVAETAAPDSALEVAVADAQTTEPAREAAAEGPGDGAAGSECVRAADCAGRPSPPALGFCPGSAWSCLAGRCTWECTDGRTCDRDDRGCIGCTGDTGPRRCPGLACAVTAARPRIEQATCTPAPDPGGWTCFGEFAQLASGAWCSLESLPTGLVRWALSCGACQATIVE